MRSHHVAGWSVAGWSVGVEGASVGAGGGGGAVGVAGQFPAPAVDDDQVVKSAEQAQVPQWPSPPGSIFAVISRWQR